MLRSYQALAVLICLMSSIQVYGDYTGDKVVRLTPSTTAHLNYLRSLEDDGSVDFWTEILSAARPVDARISRKDFNKFTNKFRQMSLPYTVVVDDVQKLIDDEQLDIAKLISGREMSMRPGQTRIDIAGLYVSYADILTYMDEKAAADPTRLAVVNIGNTYQNRALKGIVLKYNPSAQRNIWIDCGIHAREWISPAVCVWMVDKLTAEYQQGNTQVRDLLNYWNVYIVPSLNPDGYEFSRTAGNRLWRKSRNVNSGSTCIGVDLNRNFPNNWYTGGSSNNPCSDTYAGRSAGSEPETAAIVNFLLSKLGTWDMYMSFHSYGQWWFTPYAYKTASPPDYAKQKQMADIGANSIQSVNGRKYDVGTVAQLLYIASGSTVDFAYENLGVKYSYTVELPPTSAEASIGFVWPPNLVTPVCNETYIGMKTFLTAVKNDLSGSTSG